MEKVLFRSLGNFSLQYREWSLDKIGKQGRAAAPYLGLLYIPGSHKGRQIFTGPL